VPILAYMTRQVSHALVARCGGVAEPSIKFEIVLLWRKRNLFTEILATLVIVRPYTDANFLLTASDGSYGIYIPPIHSSHSATRYADMCQVLQLWHQTADVLPAATVHFLTFLRLWRRLLRIAIDERFRLRYEFRMALLDKILILFIFHSITPHPRTKCLGLPCLPCARSR